MPIEIYQRLGLALAIGLLVGVERGWQAREVAEGGRTAGIRTFALSGLLGGLAGLLSQSLGGWAFAALALPYAAAVILFKYRELQTDNDYSVTLVVAALLVFGLGAYAAIGHGTVAAAAAVVATAFLAFKQALHGWLLKLTWPELRGALILLAMSFVALPLLPNQGYGPYGAVNPHELWLLTIALAGVSFAAYGLIRIFGDADGAVLAGIAGALVSSTAAALSVARLEKQSPRPATHAAAALLAGVVMTARLALIAAALSLPLLVRLAAPLAAFAVVSLLAGGALYLSERRKAPADGRDNAMTSPFDLTVVVRFALLLGVVMAASRVLSGLYGPAGLLPVAAIAGLADVDAVALTAGRMAGQGLGLETAALAILIAAGVDTASKTVIAGVVGGWRLGGLFAAGSMLAAGAAGLAMVLLVK